MKQLITSAAAGLLLAISPTIASAQEREEPTANDGSADAATSSAYDQLVAVLSPDALHEATYANTLEQLRAFYFENPNIALLEKRCSGLVEATLLSAGPAMREFHFAEADAIREVLRTIFQENFTPQEALEAAQLYGSPLGQKIVMSAGRSQNFRNTMESAVRNEDGSVDPQSFDRDANSTASNVIRELTADEIEEFGRAAMQTSVFAKFSALNPTIQQRRFELLNSDVLQEYRVKMEQALQAGMAAHLETCK